MSQSTADLEDGSPSTLKRYKIKVFHYWVVLSTGRLTIARAIGQFFLGGGGGEDELRKFTERKKKKNIARIRTHAHSFNGPVQLPLAHRYTLKRFV